MTRVDVAAAGLCVVAGYCDAVAFRLFGGYAVSFMNGNAVRDAVEVRMSGLWLFGVALVGFFLVGVVVAALERRANPGQPDATTLVHFLTFAGLSVIVSELGAPRAVCGVLLALSLGGLNVMFSGNEHGAFGPTYLNGAVVRLGLGVAVAVGGGGHNMWRRNLLLSAGIGVGAVAGAAVYAMVGMRSLWVVVAVAGVAAVGVAWPKANREPPAKSS